MSEIKIHYDMLQGELPQKEERLRKTFFCVFMQTDLPPRINYTERRKTKLTKTVGKNSCLKKS